MRNTLITAGVLACMGAAHGQAATGSANPPKTWATCAACHAVQGAAALGPSLNGVLGRKSGSVPGFAYSRAMKSASITWDEKSLQAFLADPQKVVPGNRMPFAGVPEPSEATELVHYLKTLR
jgi:cytochrome c